MKGFCLAKRRDELGEDSRKSTSMGQGTEADGKQCSVYAETGSEDQNDEKRNLGGGQETGQVG